MIQRRRDVVIDALKGLAIIAVALYHFGGGYLPYGYLGVDVFFVVGGYLLINQLYKQFLNNEFNYWKFIIRKIVRLWPLIILAAFVSVIVGFFLMLPDDYENLAESAIASSFFAENVLESITTKNYWDIVNLYKPLMHLWYVGVLMQSYVLIPLFYLAVLKLHKDTKKSMISVTILITVVSLVLFLLPSFTDAQKFYYPPFRFFEISAGGLLFFLSPKTEKNCRLIIGSVALVTLLILIVTRGVVISSVFMLLLTVIVTMVILSCFKGESFENRIIAIVVNFFASIGKRSYSIYIWHQVVIAFLFYAFFSKQSLLCLLVAMVFISILALLSYRFIEIPLDKTIREKKQNELVVIFSTIVVAILVCSISFWIYIHAGVVRDVPELNILKFPS